MVEHVLHECGTVKRVQLLASGDMSILRYFERRDGLPDPKGSLSRSIAPGAISAANKEVQRAVSQQEKKRGAYNRFVTLVTE